MKDMNTILGIAFVLSGLMEILVMPAFLQRCWRQPQPNSAMVLRIVRITGLFMMILGLLFFAGLITMP